MWTQLQSFEWRVKSNIILHQPYAFYLLFPMSALISLSLFSPCSLQTSIHFINLPFLSVKEEFSHKVLLVS